MNPIIKNVFAVILGWAGGSAVNMGLIKAGHSLFPIANLDPNDMEAFATVIPTLGSEHFIFPFLAHALGTFVGAILAALIASTYKMKFSLGIGLLFLFGGIAVNYMLPGPTWFAFLDIAVAYIPMAWIGGKLGCKFSR